MERFLPMVTNEVGGSIAHSIPDCDDDTYNVLMKFVEKDNPAVAQFIQNWTKLAEDEDAALHSAFCGLFVYKLLFSQAEADYMDANFT